MGAGAGLDRQARWGPIVRVASTSAPLFSPATGRRKEQPCTVWKCNGSCCGGNSVQLRATRDNKFCPPLGNVDGTVRSMARKKYLCVFCYGGQASERFEAEGGTNGGVIVRYRHYSQ